MNFIREISLKMHNHFIEKEENKFFAARHHINYTQAKKFGLIFQITDRKSVEAVLTLKKMLISDTKELVYIGYADEYSTDDCRGIEESVCKEHSFTLWGKVNDTLIENFLNKEYDFLMYANLQKIPALEYLAIHAHAKHKICLYDANKQNSFDFMIGRPHTKAHLNQCIEEMLGYLKLLM